ncbi:Ribosomal RNA small subunit methyltransferase B [uncultured Eubacterium sp.]|jgi:16S rRNA (cytosine967-C5)-methyltransferase|nr:16S rRNA (cytosine(967)-C(5))-methyltransferase RsmB [uncultured Anaerostipes sp.]SCI86563.1 Ribosomal RNA small subunit methyltransferase B [uncultured Eubacterium sp.]
MENPRESALDVLIKVDKKEELSHIAISNVLEKYQFSEKRDRAFFTRLVEGTLERQITIDYVIDQFSKTKIRKCKPLIRALLRMGVYQILYMDQVPDSAACNEAVKLAKKRGFSRLSGFVNGVLRNISRKKETISYPKKDKDLVTYLSVTYSIPEWIINFFKKTYDDETVEKIIASYLEDRKTTLCCLESKGGKDAVRKELEAENVTVEDGKLIENAVKISDYDFLYRLKAFREGKCYVQDESSMLCAKLAGAEEGQFVMDLCSAPGGKSLYTADQMKDSGQILSRDLTEYKTDLIEDNIERMGFTNMVSEVFDATVLDEEHIEAADVVIADVPCSGLGIMGKKNDIKYHISEEGMKDLVKLQREILTNAVQYVKHGGTLIYSTCTINPEENEKNFQWIKDHFDYEAVDITEELPHNLKIDTAKDGYIQLLPGIHPCDGFFIGKLRRK